MKNKINAVLLVGLLSALFLASVQAAFFPLEITNIKPAGTGSPAIPATNRIFRAYPGTEYNIRAAAIGGVYPYTYSLSNAPSGMTINSATGEITWPNPQSNSGTISLSVTDSEATTVSTTWAITVTTSGFHFVDANAATNGTGTSASPYNSFANFVAATEDIGAEDDIIYFLPGDYLLIQNPTGNTTLSGPEMNLTNLPKTWLAHPNNTTPATIIGSRASGRASFIGYGSATNNLYIDGLVFRDMINFAFFMGGRTPYTTFRRNLFTGLEPDTDINRNYGFIYSAESTTHSYGMVIQDNEFTDWTNTAAIGSLYTEDKILIENNRIHSLRATSIYSGIGTTIGIGAKHDNDYVTIRGNSIIMNKGWLVAGLNGAYAESDYSEICFNLFVNTTEGSTQASSYFDHSVNRQGSAKIWRNTNLSQIGIRGETSGPFTVEGNIISNDGEEMQWNATVLNYFNYMASSPFPGTYTSNLTGLDASLLVDSANSYKLVPAQSAYIGTRGWQFADGSTPMDGTYTTPSAVKTRINTSGNTRFVSGEGNTTRIITQ